MDDDDAVLSGLADRLRSLAGHASATPATPAATSSAAAAEERVSEVALLTLQQSLRRHPAVQLLGGTRHDCRLMLFEQVQAALSPSAARAATTDAQTGGGGCGNGDDALQLLHYVNETAQQLELERLSGVYADATAAMTSAQRRLLARLGVDEAPALHANSLSFACPWNVLFTLLAGDELAQLYAPASCARRLHPTNGNNNNNDDDDDDSRTHARTTPHVANATASVQAHLRRIRRDCHDSDAWLALLHELDALPLVSTRAVWLAALHHFPSAGVVAVAYLSRELDELQRGDVVKLHECAAVTDARAAYTRYLRILNVFFRHLPLTYSCPLYRLFFDFVGDYVQPDAGSLDALYRTCLRRDVGHLPQSGELWLRYVQWRAGGMHDLLRRREWRRRMYRRMLQTPLDNLDAVRLDYDAFVATELRNRVAPDERADVDKRFARARAEAAELLQRYAIVFALGHAPWPSTRAASGSHDGDDDAQHVYLPQPCTIATAPVDDDEATSTPRWAGRVCRRARDGHNGGGGEADADSDDDDDGSSRRRQRRAAVRLWVAWHGLLEHVTHRALSASSDVAAGVGGGGDAMSAQQHYARRRAYLHMRACALAHHEVAWVEYMHFCAHAPASLAALAERRTSVHEALDTALQFVPRALLVRLYAADLYHGSLDEPARAVAQMASALATSRATLLRCLAGDDGDARTVADEALAQLQNIATVAVNWLRLCVSRGGGGGGGRGKDALRLVARYVMHTIDFLSLTLSVVKALLRSGAIAWPAALLRPFNTFCRHWLLLELVHHHHHHNNNKSRRTTSADNDDDTDDSSSDAFVLLGQWAQHLKMMLRSAKARRWSAKMCGVDESFLDSCVALLHAAPSPAAASAVLRHVRDLQSAVCAHSVDGAADAFAQQCAQLRHRFFDADAWRGEARGDDATSPHETTTPPSPLLLPREADAVHTRALVCRYAAAPRCGTAPYSTRSVTPRALALHVRARAHEYACMLHDAASHGAASTRTDDSSAVARAAVAMTHPDESMWTVARTTTTATGGASATAQAHKQRQGGNASNHAGMASNNADADDAAQIAAAMQAYRPSPRHAGAPSPYSRRSCLVQVERPVSLADLLARCGRAESASTAKMPPLDQLQELIEQLPTVYEYSCDGDVDVDTLTVDWLVHTLRHCQALR